MNEGALGGACQWAKAVLLDWKSQVEAEFRDATVAEDAFAPHLFCRTTHACRDSGLPFTVTLGHQAPKPTYFIGLSAFFRSPWASSALRLYSAALYNHPLFGRAQALGLLRLGLYDEPTG